MHDSCVARARPSARCRCRTRAGGQPTGASEGAGGSNLNYFTYGLIRYYLVDKHYKHLYLLNIYYLCMCLIVVFQSCNEDVCSVNRERDKGIKVDF